jgi:PAS domain S-box-containing protein
VNTEPTPDDIQLLHVDDEPAFGELVATFLDRHDDLVVTTVDGPAAALDHLDDVDCVVSDFDMPAMDGLTFLRRVRDRAPDLPFVLFTGKGNEEIASEAIAAGVDGYLQKGGGSQQYELLANRIRTVVSEARANARARQVTEQLQTVYERTTDGVVAVDREWRYSYVNAQAEAMLCVGAEDLVGRDVWETFPALVGTTFETELRAAMETGEERSFDAYFGPLETHFAVRAFPGEEGLSIYVRDVTDEERTRTELAAERRLLDGALDALDDIFYVLDGSGERLVRWNDGLETLTGRTAAELSSVDLTELFVAEDRATVERTMAYVTDGNQATGSARLDTPDGPRLYEFRTVPLYGDAGGFTGACGIGRDVTTQREHEAHLERVETVVEALGDPVYTTDAAGELTYINDAFVDLTGYDPEVALGSDAAALLKDETGREDALRAIRTARRTDAPQRFEFDLQTADGRAIPCEDHLSLLPTDSDFRGTAGVVRDVSRRKGREATLLRQRDQLDEFASVVSHDLRNPLSVAVGHVRLARERGETDPLETAETALERMDQMVDDLLSLARTGAVVADPEQVALGTVARAAWSMTETDDVSLVVEPGLLTVSGDPSRLAGLFENLFRNAAEHGLRGRPSSGVGDRGTHSMALTNGKSGETDDTPDPPREPFEVRVGPLPPATDRGFFVEDDGVGFDTDLDSDDLFDSGVSTAHGGTGYGLAIVRDVAEAHGWTVDATTAANGGARFEFRVPG